MNYVMLALAGILSGGIVFGAKILFMSGATLFEVMLFPNLMVQHCLRRLLSRSLNALSAFLRS